MRDDWVRELIRVVCTLVLTLAGLALVWELHALNARLAAVQIEIERNAAAHERTERIVREAGKRFGLDLP